MARSGDVSAFDMAASHMNHVRMSTRTQVLITDDLDGSADAETFTFAFGGASYEIDLSEDNRAKFADAIGPYVEAARRQTPIRAARRAAAAPKHDLSAVRFWAKENGLQVSDRGRISSEILQQYEAARRPA